MKKLAHSFDPSTESEYCGHWNVKMTTGDRGSLIMGSQCGFPEATHMNPVELAEWLRLKPKPTVDEVRLRPERLVT